MTTATASERTAERRVMVGDRRSATAVLGALVGVGLAPLVDPRGMQGFFGAWDPQAPPVGLMERLVGRMPAADATLAGGLRDWAAMDALAADIARELSSTETAAARSG